MLRFYQVTHPWVKLSNPYLCTITLCGTVLCTVFAHQCKLSPTLSQLHFPNALPPSRSLLLHIFTLLREMWLLLRSMFCIFFVQFSSPFALPLYSNVHWLVTWHSLFFIVLWLPRGETLYVDVISALLLLFFIISFKSVAWSVFFYLTARVICIWSNSKQTEKQGMHIKNVWRWKSVSKFGFSLTVLHRYAHKNVCLQSLGLKFGFSSSILHRKKCPLTQTHIITNLRNDYIWFGITSINDVSIQDK